MNNDNEKNINLMLVQNDDDNEKRIFISFTTFFRQLKRFLSVWLVLAVVSGLLVTSLSILMAKTTTAENVIALVSYNYNGITSGLAPDGTALNVNKIKSPTIIEEALTNIGEPLTLVESVRRNITIQGVISDNELDRFSLYQKIYSNGGSASLEAVDQLLSLNGSSTHYIVNFKTDNISIDHEDAANILNEILRVYQEYFFTRYGFSSTLGNSVVAVDYTEYDYPAAVDIFRTLLDDLDGYILSVQGSDDTGFRSPQTGYSFSDIRRSIDVVRTSDLDALSAYITIYNITKDKDRLLTYYKYKIEELERDAEVLKTELESISNSINSYEKDSMLIFGENANLDETSYSQASEKYDQLIEEKIAVAKQHSAKLQNIEYYKLRLKTFENNVGKSGGDFEYVEEELKDIYEKINDLIDITTVASDEYYENIVFANAFNILVPAVEEEQSDIVYHIMLPLIISEGLLFVVYISYSFIKSLIIEAKKSAQKTNTDDEKENDT